MTTPYMHKYRDARTWHIYCSHTRSCACNHTVKRAFYKIRAHARNTHVSKAQTQSTRIQHCWHAFTGMQAQQTHTKHARSYVASNFPKKQVHTHTHTYVLQYNHTHTYTYSLMLPTFNFIKLLSSPVYTYHV